MQNNYRIKTFIKTSPNASSNVPSNGSSYASSNGLVLASIKAVPAAALYGRLGDGMYTRTVLQHVLTWYPTTGNRFAQANHHREWGRLVEFRLPYLPGGGRMEEAKWSRNLMACKYLYWLRRVNPDAVIQPEPAAAATCYSHPWSSSCRLARIRSYLLPHIQ